jgi:hypothetical protein
VIKLWPKVLTAPNPCRHCALNHTTSAEEERAIGAPLKRGDIPLDEQDRATAVYLDEEDRCLVVWTVGQHWEMATPAKRKGWVVLQNVQAARLQATEVIWQLK